MTTSNALQRSIMDTNLSFSDRQIRFVIGATMIAGTLVTMPETLGMWSIVLLGSIPFISMAITGWDPVYAMLGKSTYVEGEEDIQQRSWTCPNVGTVDRGVRLGTGLLLIYALMTMSAMHADMIITLFAIPLIVSAITAWDPFYAMLGINSFASQVDVAAVEPDASEETLAACYEFPQRRSTSADYPQAA
ncbi:YgaP family membrane protein [Kaarinaea lacus]